MLGKQFPGVWCSPVLRSGPTRKAVIEMKHLLTFIGAMSCIVLLLSDDALAQSPVGKLPGWKAPSIVSLEPTSVRIAIETDAAISGAVVYGPGEGYGSQADIEPVDDEPGTYGAVLSGLSPNSTYHYRVELSDDQGNEYVSSDDRFVTPNESEPAAFTERPAQENLASIAAGAHIVGVSSNLGGSDNSGEFGAHKAIDGLSDTFWASDGDGNDAWIEIGLARECDVRTVGLWSPNQDPSARVFRFLVVSDRGETVGPFELPDTDRIYYFPVELTARQLRFELTETGGGNAGTISIEVFGRFRGD